MILKSSLVDEISMNVYNYPLKYVLEPFTFIIDCSSNEFIFPNNSKKATAELLLKKGNENDLDYYRPIYTLFSFLKNFREKSLLFQCCSTVLFQQFSEI